MEKFTQAMAALAAGQDVDVEATIGNTVLEVVGTILLSGRSAEVLAAAVRLAMEAEAFHADESRDDEWFDATSFLASTVWDIADPLVYVRCSCGREGALRASAVGVTSFNCGDMASHPEGQVRAAAPAAA